MVIDDDDVHVFYAITPCYCKLSMLGAHNTNNNKNSNNNNNNNMQVRQQTKSVEIPPTVRKDLARWPSATQSQLAFREISTRISRGENAHWPHNEVYKTIRLSASPRREPQASIVRRALAKGSQSVSVRLITRREPQASIVRHALA